MELGYSRVEISRRGTLGVVTIDCREFHEYEIGIDRVGGDLA